MRYVEVGGARMSVIGLGHMAVRLPRVGVRRRVRGQDGARDHDPCARPRHHPHRHRGGLRLRTFGAHARRDPRGGRAPGRGLPRDEDLPGGAARADPRGTSEGEREAAAHGRHRSVPGALAEPGRLRLVLDDGDASRRRLGLVRHAGVSNYPLDRWKGAEVAFGGPILSNQVSFSLIDRRPLRDLVPFAQEQGRVIIAYSPLAQGVLGGKYDAQTRPVGVARRMNPLFLPENLERAAPLIDALREIAKSHQCKPAQVALAWLIRMPNVVAIPGASSIEQVEFNAAAAEVELTDGEDAQLLDAAKRFEPVGGVDRARGMAESLVGVVRDRLGLGSRRRKVVTVGLQIDEPPRNDRGDARDRDRRAHRPHLRLDLAGVPARSVRPLQAPAGHQPDPLQRGARELDPHALQRHGGRPPRPRPLLRGARRARRTTRRTRCRARCSRPTRRTTRACGRSSTRPSPRAPSSGCVSASSRSSTVCSTTSPTRARWRRSPTSRIRCPITVIAEMLGVPASDRDFFRDASSKIAVALGPITDPSVALNALEGRNQLVGYFNDLIPTRKGDPRDDLISAMLAAEEAGDFLSHGELLAMLLLLLVAGHETTVNLIGNGLLALLRNPEQAERLRTDESHRTLCRRGAPALRLTRPVHGTPRHGGLRARRPPDQEGDGTVDDRRVREPRSRSVRRSRRAGPRT